AGRAAEQHGAHRLRAYVASRPAVARGAPLRFIVETLYYAVMPRGTTVEALAEVTEDQWGLFTRRQAESTGMAWTTLTRLVNDNAAERIAHGVYRLRGAPAADHLALRAAWMQ